MPLSGCINVGIVGGITGGAQNPAEVLVTFNSPRPTPAQLADALIKSLGLSESELTGFRQDTGVDLRQSYIDDFKRNGINYNHIRYAGRDPQTNARRYTGSVGVPPDFRQRLATYAARDGNAPPPTDSRAGGNGAAATTARGQELTARGAMLRRQLERRQETNDVKRELLGLPDTATTLGAASTIALNRLPQVARTAAPVLPEVAPVVLPAAISVGGAALIINGQLDSAIERYLDTQRTAPPPPLQMSDAEDAPPLTTPTDTATRPTQPDVQAAPESGTLTRPAPNVAPATAQPTTRQPTQPSAPQGEPPRPPRLTPSDLLPPAIGAGTATVGVTVSRSNESLGVNDTRQRDARGVPDVDYRSRTYTVEQRQRINTLGTDPKRGLRLEEGEAGLAAESNYNLRFTRYNQEGLEFREQSGEYWDVVSPISYAKNGRHVFNISDAVDSVKDHCLKGNVIVDYGRMNNADAEALRRAIAGMSDADKRGRQIIFVRNGE